MRSVVDSIRVDDSNRVDNKLLYEKATMRELESADDFHPLKTDKPDRPRENDGAMQELTSEMESVALDWKTLRNITECHCSTPFDHFSRKVIARNCFRRVNCFLRVSVPLLAVRAGLLHAVHRQAHQAARASHPQERPGLPAVLR